jgi:Ca2+-binding RTX toxin-like protein
VPTCFGQPATIVGTDGPDTLIGQSGVADVIYGGGGDDGIGGEHYDTAQSSSLDRVTAVENNFRVIRENGPSD